MRSRGCIGTLALVAATWPLLATATDGAVEINQTCAVGSGCAPGDTSGFPIDLLQSGKYVLTSDLSHDPAVHGNTEIVRVLADDITLDLNGFTIRSTSTCEADACDAGSVDGIDSGNADRATILNGRVIGVNGNCIRLQTQASIRDVVVRHCGLLGISVGPSSVVQDCRIGSTGRTGLHTFGVPPINPAGTLYRTCTFEKTGLRGETLLPDMDASVSRTARAVGANSCDDSLCGNGQRRFYLTPTLVTGENAPVEACDPGFHMASMWEIHDPSHLSYDRQRGVGNDDSGFGPPSLILVPPLDSRKGWIRTGSASVSGVVAPPGFANCGSWTQSSGNGTAVGLSDDWTSAGSIDWKAAIEPCSEPLHVWCVED